MVPNTKVLGTQGQYDVIIGTLEAMGLLAITSARRLRRAHGVKLSVKALEFQRVASTVSVESFWHIRGALVASVQEMYGFTSGLGIQKIFRMRTLNKVLAVTGF
jgi:hypothetical protein